MHQPSGPPKAVVAVMDRQASHYLLSSETQERGR